MAGDWLLVNAQSLELGDSVFGALPVVICYIERQFLKRDALVPAFLAYVGEVRHLR
jgi:hypothetical protein